MAKRAIYLTVRDKDRLDLLLISSAGTELDADSLEALEQDLDQAKLVPPGEIPTDVVTMNSQVRVRNLDTGEVQSFILVFPEFENEADNRLSILRPIAAAVLGHKKGDKVQWPTPEGMLNLQIEESCYEAEGAGRFS